MRKPLLAALTAALTMPAAQACMVNDVQEKMSNFTQRYQELAQKSPEKLRAFAPKVQAAMEKYRQAASSGTTNYGDLCKLYDELNAELEKA